MKPHLTICAQKEAVFLPNWSCKLHDRVPCAAVVCSDNSLLSLLCNLFLTKMADAMEMMLMGFLAPAARCEFGLTDIQVALISTVSVSGLLLVVSFFLCFEADMHVTSSQVNRCLLSCNSRFFILRKHNKDYGLMCLCLPTCQFYSGLIDCCNKTSSVPSKSGTGRIDSLRITPWSLFSCLFWPLLLNVHIEFDPQVVGKGGRRTCHVTPLCKRWIVLWPPSSSLQRIDSYPSPAPDKKVLLTNGAQPPAVTLGRAVATTGSRPDEFVSLLKVSRLVIQPIVRRNSPAPLRLSKLKNMLVRLFVVTLWLKGDCTVG